MKSIIKPLLALLVTAQLTACAFEPYDASDPQKYTDYWCDQANIENSLLYQLASDKANKHKQPELLRTQPCHQANIGN